MADETPQPFNFPDQSFMGTARVGIDINGNIWQYQGDAGLVMIGTGAIPTIAEIPEEK